MPFHLCEWEQEATMHVIYSNATLIPCIKHLQPDSNPISTFFDAYMASLSLPNIFQLQLCDITGDGTARAGSMVRREYVYLLGAHDNGVNVEIKRLR